MNTIRSLFENLNDMDKLMRNIMQYSETVFKLIKEYSVSKNKEAVLRQINDELEQVNNLLKQNGYTYTPPSDEDYDEEDFEDVLEMFGDFLKRYMKEFNIRDIEVYNTEIKQMVSLIDRHLNGFVNENAVIIDEE